MASGHEVTADPLGCPAKVLASYTKSNSKTTLLQTVSDVLVQGTKTVSFPEQVEHCLHTVSVEPSHVTLAKYPGGHVEHAAHTVFIVGVHAILLNWPVEHTEHGEHTTFMVVVHVVML
jgi:hypothetical protein